MKSQVNAVKDTPIRIKILKRAFEEGWNLEQVNSELEKHFCERLYARNRYEAGLIYAFQNRISYEAWKELYQKYIEQGRNMENREDGIKKKRIFESKKQRASTYTSGIWRGEDITFKANIMLDLGSLWKKMSRNFRQYGKRQDTISANIYLFI